ncbi:unnamed protein product [Microthlaspi erraticum]|uniref:Uncharacterized protein n=1 Tax=Microthlaspi erraticum TaxID=1685480 RepID=A0A6D2IWT0_9BRAS|nr:unnamed protein product [Microthlaspi erraticum]
MEQKEPKHQVPKSRAPNLYFSLKTKPEHPKYGRIFMPSRRPKVMMLIWKDRYLSHASRRSGKRSFGSFIGPELIFSASAQVEPVETLTYLKARATAPKALARLNIDLTRSRRFHWPELGPFKNLESKLKRLKRNGNFPLLGAPQLCRPRPALYLYILAFSLL